MYRFARFFLLLISLFFHGIALAGQGYITDVQAEKDLKYYEVFFYYETPKLTEGKLSDVIFNKELSTEFKNRYRDTFRQMDTESLNYQVTNFYLLDQNKAQVQQTEQANLQRKEFAEYMIKRLFEFHSDNYFKTQPEVRQVYELKEKLSKIEVEMAQDFKFRMNYSYSSNIFDLSLVNPTYESRLSVEMDPKSFGPTKPREEWLWINKKINKKVKLFTSTQIENGIFYTYVGKSWTQRFATSFGVSTYFKPLGSSTREQRLVLGMSHTY